MVKRKNLAAMYRSPGNVTGADLMKAAEERGWAYSHTEGSHAIYRKDGRHLSIPVDVRGLGTIRRLVQLLQEDE